MGERDGDLVRKEKFENEMLAQLPKEMRDEIMEKHANAMSEVVIEHYKKESDSAIAQRDTSSFLNDVKDMDSDKKVYTAKHRAKTGSGEQSWEIKGGDTRFIVPIIVAIGIVILFAIFLFLPK